MHPRNLAQRTEAAQSKIEQGAGDISRLLGLGDELAGAVAAVERDREIQAMLRMEGVAALLDQATPAVSSLQEQLAGAQQVADELAAQIGTPPEGSHPDEALPRSATWHEERANWLAETEQMRAHIANVEQQLKVAQAEATAARERIATLEAAVAKSSKKKAADEPDPGAPEATPKPTAGDSPAA